MTETILVIAIAILAYLCGRYHNYLRWVISGRVYAAARKTYQENQDLKLEKAISEHEVKK